MITLQHTQEELSIAYIVAVAGRAGHNLSIDRRHDYGVDGTFRQVERRDHRRCETGFAVDFQAKASHQWASEDGLIVYDVEAQAYNDLVIRAKRPRAMPLILILLCLCEQECDWLQVTDENLILRRCAYWAKLDGTITENDQTKRIRLPSQNLFTPEALREILRKVADGGAL